MVLKETYRHGSLYKKEFIREDNIMALSIINNSTAIGAQSSVNNANNNLTKTIKALSTGLRINSASDDASGLAVSEKLRAQISGLNKAATNAQDAISMLQTAEGAMGSMTSMVQRIRELAVQAGDPAYTSNDRAMLQLEVDQLKQEIDRVSTSTEFNTKKLLNGDAAALWSASNGNIEAIVKGAAAEGNYKVSYDLDPGRNAVYKSNIMRLGEGEMSYNIDTNGTSITKFDNIQGMLRGSDMTIKVKGTAATTASAVFTGGTGGMNSAAMTAAGFTSTALATVTGGNSYSIEFEALGKRTASGTGQIRFRVMNTKTGELSEWKTASVNSAGAVLNASAISTGLAGLDKPVLTSAATTFTATAAWTSGDKMLVNVAGVRASSSTSATIQIGSTGSTLHINADATNSATATTHTVYTSQMDDAGNVYYGSMDIKLEKGDVVSGTASIDILGAGDVASKYTKLSQLAQFTNADGRMVLDNTQEISIYAGNGKTAKVTLEGSDTIADLESKLTAALVDQLGMGADVTNTSATTVNNNLVKFVETKGTGDRAVAGTFVIQGAVLGDSSNLTFVGDEGVLNALGINQIQKATDSALNVRVQDAHTGAFIGEDTVTDGRLRNIIEGVDIDIIPSSAADIAFDTATNTMKFLAKAEPEVAYLHIKDNSTVAAIGANEGQTLDISIGRLDTKSMGIDGVNVATFDDAQSSITKLDMALEQISKARATAGAQMNRLEYTISNLNTTRENMVAAESRIRDLDIAVASTNLAAQQVLMQSATAMLAQANQIPSYAMQLLG
ncbi:MAG: flagellin [Mucispirillum schaedleri]|nr:flagellin [Mucispirillum schaedleri]